MKSQLRVVTGFVSVMPVSSLTRAAGVNRTSFHSHFSSPEDLAIHALGVIGAWLAGQPPQWSPDQLVEALIQGLPGWLAEEKEA
jgi:AcrR family transcriptional regulator